MKENHVYLFPCKRHELLDYFPRGGSWCEIGVAFGAFSIMIINRVMPQKLHLIDPWQHLAEGGFSKDPVNVSDENHEKRYQKAVDLLKQNIETGQVEVHRTLSVEAVKQFNDGYFDAIYIDADHTYDAVLEDLRLFAPKLKPNGILYGDDFANHAFSKTMGYGVMEAVFDFCNESEFTLFAITSDPHPNFVLVRDPDSKEINDFLAMVMFHCPNLFRLKGITRPDQFTMDLKQVTLGDKSNDGVVVDINL